MALQISPPPTATTSTVLQSAVTLLAPVEVSVSSTPPNIDELLRQISISGTVTAPPANNTVTLATALGNFTFSFAQLPEATKQQLIQQLMNLLQNQKTLTAVIQPGSPPTQATILLPTTSNAAPAPGPVVTQGQQLPVPPQTLTLSAGTSLPAIVLPPDIVVPGAKVPAAQPLTNSVPPELTATPPNASTTAATPTAPNPTPAQSAPAAPTTPAATAPTETIVTQLGTTPAPAPGTPAATPVAPSLLQAGKTVIVTIDAVTLPNAAPPVPTAANQVPATVIGNGANGQLILKTGDATLYVRSNVEAPVGTNLLITLEAPKPASPAVVPPLPVQNFRSLQQVLDALAQINPQLAQQIVETQIPQPNAQLAGPLLFFLSALKQGDMKGWLGQESVEVLTKAGKLELIAKLTHDMKGAVATEHDPAVGEWKSYTVPLRMDGQFQPLTLHVHADGQGQSPSGDDKTSATKPSQIRFLIDMRMSRLGSMQLDGLVKPQKLDMILRSESVLPAGLPQDLRKTYIASLEAAGFTGSLSFQTGKQHWLTPRKEIPQSLLT